MLGFFCLGVKFESLIVISVKIWRLGVLGGEVSIGWWWWCGVWGWIVFWFKLGFLEGLVGFGRGVVIL